MFAIVCPHFSASNMLAISESASKRSLATALAAPLRTFLSARLVSSCEARPELSGALVKAGGSATPVWTWTDQGKL